MVNIHSVCVRVTNDVNEDVIKIRESLWCHRGVNSTPLLVLRQSCFAVASFSPRVTYRILRGSEKYQLRRDDEEMTLERTVLELEPFATAHDHMSHDRIS